MVSIANMFRNVQQVITGAPPAPAPVPAPAPTAPEPTALDVVGDLWKTDPAVKQPVNPFATPLLNTDPVKIAEATSKMNVVGDIDPALLTKAMSGQDPVAFMQVLNQTAQRTLATATQINSATVEKATQLNNERFEAALPDRIKQVQLDQMVSDNPALSHPASQPFLQLLRSQVQMKNPGLTPQEINARAEAALTGYATQLATPVTPENQQGRTSGTDWDTWVSS